MPYISREDRNGIITGSIRVTTENPGRVTYRLFKSCLHFLPKEPCFSDYCVLLGALEAAKLELYRRYIAPYEDKKMKEHGDVY